MPGAQLGHGRGVRAPRAFYQPRLPWNPTVALVVGVKTALTATDLVVQARLVGLGFRVILVEDVDAADLTRHLVVIAESISGADVNTKYRNATMPVVNLDHALNDDFDHISSASTLGGSEDIVVILDSAHPMAAGFSGNVTVQASPARIDYADTTVLAASAQLIYRREDVSTQVVTFGYEKGATMQAAHVAEARRVFFGMAAEGAGNTLNASGLLLLDAAILWAMGTAAEVAGVTVTPDIATLALAAFAPTVTATANQSVEPGLATLTLAAFAPTVTASDHKSVTPGVASLTLTTFAPTAGIGVNVTPATAGLTLTSFAPTVSLSDHKLVTPGIATLTLTGFAPVLNLTVTPGVRALTLATFAPTVTATAHQTVTPTTAALTLTTFAPGVVGGAGLTVVPSVASLNLTAFAPTVVLSDHKLVTPTTASLALTAFAPNVVLSDHKLVTPTTASLTLTRFAPTVTVAAGNIVVVPGTAALILTTFAPSIGEPVVVGGTPPGIGTAVHSIVGGGAVSSVPVGASSYLIPVGSASHSTPES